MTTGIDPAWRGYKRAQIARSLDDKALLAMLHSEAKEIAGQAGNIAFRLALRFFGLRADELMLSGYEIDRLYRLAGREPPKQFLQKEGYYLPVKALFGLLERIQSEKRPTVSAE